MYSPPLGLANPHLQTILSSVGPRRWLVRRAFEQYRPREQNLILDCHDGIRLAGVYNQAGNEPANSMAILIHGWEGSADSSYMLSLTTRLLEQGVDVFRLNLRDHGESHHLNEGIFNSTLVAEVISGLEDLQRRLPHFEYNLVGFSLGGNFALRVAALAHNRQVQLAKVIAFCPALHAGRSNTVLNSRANFIYGQYFVRKWKLSLRKKIAIFPEYEFGGSLSEMNNLDVMNQALIPKYTEFENVDDYFAAYAITGDTLNKTICPCYLHFAKDDMIIPWRDVSLLADNADLNITITENGGHCGYLSNWRFESWQDDRVVELINTGQAT